MVLFERTKSIISKAPEVEEGFTHTLVVFLLAPAFPWGKGAAAGFLPVFGGYHWEKKISKSCFTRCCIILWTLKSTRARYFYHTRGSSQVIADAQPHWKRWVGGNSFRVCGWNKRLKVSQNIVALKKLEEVYEADELDAISLPLLSRLLAGCTGLSGLKNGGRKGKKSSIKN